ncbi:MAG: patatin-like phospholipase family protein, partial [Bryobacteraceae bacterium]
YTYFLESIGIRFLGLAGTSAGAINALLLACAGPRSEKKTRQIIHALANLDVSLLIDGDATAKKFIRTLLNGPRLLPLAINGLQNLDNLHQELGLNPGMAFHDWLKDTIGKFGVSNVRDLLELFSDVPKGLRRRDGSAALPHETNPKIAIIAADITTETKVHFPEMADLYWANPDEVNPADFVRASMSVPFLFHPFRVDDIPNDLAHKQRWHDRVHLGSNPPKSCMFVDGGVMSNFPIDIFHHPANLPGAPTFGARLGHSKRKSQNVKTLFDFAPALLNAARHTLDFDFFIKNPDYYQLVCCIDTGPHHWLNFDLTEEDKIDLFARGAEAAKQFVLGFDWQRYKRTRAKLREAFLESGSSNDQQRAT